MARTAAPDPHDPARRVERLLARHGEALARTARAHSLCEDDALDARQRALEIYLRRLSTVAVTNEGAWMRVVVRREAEAIRRARRATVDPRPRDFDALDPGPGVAPEDRVARAERARRTAEALAAVSPAQAEVLLLQAHGLSYEEIAERRGWSHRRVDRTLTRGRKAFLAAYRAIEAGDACERHAGLLAELAAGRAGHATLLALRPHLRHCLACRATVRELVRDRARAALGVLLAPLALRGAETAALLGAGGGRVAAVAAAALLGGTGLAGGWPAAPAPTAAPERPAAQTRPAPPDRGGAAARHPGWVPRTRAAAATPAPRARATPMPARTRPRPAQAPTPRGPAGGEFGPERVVRTARRVPAPAPPRATARRNAEAWSRIGPG